MRFSEIKYVLMAIKEAETYLADGYRTIASFGNGQTWFATMRHNKNGNHVTFYAGQRGYVVRKNGKTIKIVK